MLIKVYDPSSSIHIIEDVTNVVVHMNSYKSPHNGPRFEGPDMPTTWRMIPKNTGSSEDTYRFVDYTDQDGVRTRLQIDAFAYICNDSGKTIEKVEAGGIVGFVDNPPRVA